MVRPVVRGGLLLVAVLVLGGCAEQPGQRSGAPVVPTYPDPVPTFHPAEPPVLELSEPLPSEWIAPVPDEAPPQELLEQLAYPPRLSSGCPGVVVGVGPRNTGDCIDLMIPPEVVAAAGGLAEALADNGVVSRFALFPSEGSIVPA